MKAIGVFIKAASNVADVAVGFIDRWFMRMIALAMFVTLTMPIAQAVGVPHSAFVLSESNAYLWILLIAASMLMAFGAGRESRR